MKAIIKFLMEQPILYKFVQETLAGGGHEIIKKFLIKQIPRKAGTILDQGCGTGEYALLFVERYTGLDNSAKDIEFAKRHYPGKFIVGNAAKMNKLKSDSFDAVFAVGLHHHLTDQMARRAFLEAIRVTKKGGKVIIIDAMLPKNPLNIPGLILRKIDRGGYVRRAKDTIKLLPKNIVYKDQIISSFPFDYITVVMVKG